MKHCDNLNNIIVAGDPKVCSKATDRYPKTNKIGRNVKDFYFNMLQESFEIGTLKISLCKAVITLMFKHGEKSVLKNYRSSILRNCDYKILTYKNFTINSNKAGTETPAIQ